MPRPINYLSAVSVLAALADVRKTLSGRFMIQGRYRLTTTGQTFRVLRVLDDRIDMMGQAILRRIGLGGA